MKQYSDRQKSILIIIIGVILIILYLSISSKPIEIDNVFGFIGSVASISGIIITYLQIRSVRRISNDTNYAVNLAFQHFFQMFSISDMSKAVKMSEEIASLLRSEKTEVALVRMQDLKTILIQIKHIESLKELYDLDKLNDVTSALIIDIQSLNSLLIKKKNNLNLISICQNLDMISTILNEIESKVKYKGHGK